MRLPSPDSPAWRERYAKPEHEDGELKYLRECYDRARAIQDEPSPINAATGTFHAGRRNAAREILGES